MYHQNYPKNQNLQKKQTIIYLLHVFPPKHDHMYTRRTHIIMHHL